MPVNRIPLPTSAELFVAASGNDTATGLSAAAPIATLTEAFRRLGGRPATVWVDPTSPIVDSPSYRGDTSLAIRGYDNATWSLDANGADVGLFVGSKGVVSLYSPNIYGAAVDGVRLGVPSSTSPGGVGTLYAYNGTATGGTNGWATTGDFLLMDLTGCTGIGTTNDGFNVHGATAGVVYLRNCEGRDCGDEGASPHDNCVLHIIGGRYYDNASGGITSVNTSVCNLSGDVVVENNGDTTFGGVSWLDTATGSIDGATIRNNTGRGIWLPAGTAVTLGAYTSTGNTLPDVLTGAV